MQAVGSSRKVFELIDRKPKFQNDGRIAPDGRNAKVEGRIEFRNVYFSYPTRPDIPILQVWHRSYSNILAPNSNIFHLTIQWSKKRKHLTRLAFQKVNFKKLFKS